MNTDPIADLFTRIRNAQAVGLGEIRVPYSELKMKIAHLMADRGFLAGVEKEGSKTQKRLKITLAYRAGQPAIHEITRISKPGQRIYISAQDIRPVKRGRGLAIISTSRGIMDDQRARKDKIGGELIGKLW